jgi:hypothetical protein
MKRVCDLNAHEFHALLSSEQIELWDHLSASSPYSVPNGPYRPSDLEQSILRSVGYGCEDWLPFDELDVEFDSSVKLIRAVNNLIRYDLISFCGKRMWDEARERKRMQAEKGWVLRDCAVRITSNGEDQLLAMGDEDT